MDWLGSERGILQLIALATTRPIIKHNSIIFPMILQRCVTMVDSLYKYCTGHWVLVEVCLIYTTFRELSRLLSDTLLTNICVYVNGGTSYRTPWHDPRCIVPAAAVRCSLCGVVSLLSLFVISCDDLLLCLKCACAFSVSNHLNFIQAWVMCFQFKWQLK